MPKVVSEGHGDEQNNLTEDSVEEIPVETRMGPVIVDHADIEEPVFVDV